MAEAEQIEKPYCVFQTLGRGNEYYSEYIPSLHSIGQVTCDPSAGTPSGRLIAIRPAFEIWENGGRGRPLSLLCIEHPSYGQQNGNTLFSDRLIRFEDAMRIGFLEEEDSPDQIHRIRRSKRKAGDVDEDEDEDHPLRCSKRRPTTMQT